MNVPHPTDLVALDRDVARAHGAWTKWQRALTTAPDSVADEAPLDRFRHVAGQSTYEALGNGVPGAGDAAVREGLRRWVYALTQARVAQPLDVERARAALEANARVMVPKPHLTSWRASWHGLLLAQAPSERAAWLEPIVERAPAIASLERRRTERWAEVEARIRFEGSDPLFGTPAPDLVGAAETLLDRTDDLARDLLSKARRRSELSEDPPAAIDALAISVARDASEGWPARLAAPWFDEIFGAFARGLRIGVLTLPEAVGASSFARGCALFGAALRVAGASPSLPFSLAREPEFTAMHRFASVFGALPASPAFQGRVLGNVARIADAQARVLGRTALFAARLEAARFLFAKDKRPDFFEETTHRLFGAPLPRALTGAWPTPRDDARARLAGLLTALSLSRELRDRFDVDWFANPRAVAHVRAIASGPAREDPPEDPLHLTNQARMLAHTFEETLG